MIIGSRISWSKLVGWGLVAGLLLTRVSPVQAGQVLGVHILRPEEIEAADQLLSVANTQDDWQYLTIPLSLNDLDIDRWQHFFNRARQLHLIPIVRLVTRFQSGVWQIPTRKNITDQIGFLNRLDWPTDQHYLVVFNEVNHAPEWGGQLDPGGYAQILRFTSAWAKSESQNFIILPAAMDLAATTGVQTREAFAYLEGMRQADPEIFSYIDLWNSHSYPNPAFSAAATRTGQNSLRGFEQELAYLKKYTNRDFEVIITETGWSANRSTLPWLESYYTYALTYVWSHPQVRAVTPFVLQGDPGPFSSFTFLDQRQQPTAQYLALQAALKKVTNPN